MTVIILLILLIPAGVFLSLWFMRIRVKKVLIGIPVAIIIIPLLFCFGIYIFRAPIQQGKYLPQLGPLLSLAFPAEDLYTPLAEQRLSDGKKNYTLSVSHKYIGNHAVYIEVSPSAPPEFEVEKTIYLKVEFHEGDHKIIEGSSRRGSPFRGTEVHGFKYIGYTVPSDLPTGIILTARVEIEGDLHGFMEKHRNARLVIRKASDQ